MKFDKEESDEEEEENPLEHLQIAKQVVASARARMNHSSTVKMLKIDSQEKKARAV